MKNEVFTGMRKEEISYRVIQPAIRVMRVTPSKRREPQKKRNNTAIQKYAIEESILADNSCSCDSSVRTRRIATTMSTMNAASAAPMIGPNAKTLFALRKA